jgi:hypothetical protein
MRHVPRLVVCCGFALLVVTALLVSPPSATAVGAGVRNQTLCIFSVFGGTYEGAGTEVVTPSGRYSATCHTTLVSGSPVPEVTRLSVTNSSQFGPVTCEVLVTPSGTANTNCHN